MQLQMDYYHKQRETWPAEGMHILAQYDAESVVVYQAYKKAIADFAVKNQSFGGEFSFSRMSWIKPNFLWMMYRCGWASKENQEAVLAIWLKRASFDAILARAVHAQFKADVYDSQEAWQKAVAGSDVRVQWDPDHDPVGTPQARRAIQLGLRGETLRSYSSDFIVQIQDITELVLENAPLARRGSLDRMRCPRETVYGPENAASIERIFK